MAGGFQEDGRAVGSHTWVDNGNKNGAVGEVAVRVSQDHRAVAYVLRADAVGQIDDGGMRVDRKNDPAHHAYIGIGEAKVGGKNYGRSGHSDPALRDRAFRIR